MEEKIPKTIENVLQVLADKFGATGKELWRAILKQQLIDGIMEVTISIASMVPTIISIYKIASYKEDGYSELGTIGWWILLVISVGILFSSAWSALTNLVNPEYSAVDDILGKIKGDE
jgi:hypothetical protein